MSKFTTKGWLPKCIAVFFLYRCNSEFEDAFSDQIMTKMKVLYTHINLVLMDVSGYVIIESEAFRFYIGSYSTT